MENKLSIPNFTKDDFLHSSRPFEWLHEHADDQLKTEQLKAIMKDMAKAQGIQNFITMWNQYTKLMQANKGVILDNVTQFDGQEMELYTGNWTANDDGVSTFDRMGFELIACNHPIMPVQRLINIDTGMEKVKLAYRKGKNWKHITVDKKTLSSSNSIVNLSDYGVGVNSENAKYLVKYLSDIEHLNYDKLLETNSTGRLGWIDEHGFSPYVENLEFDGDFRVSHMFESVHEKGKYSKWLELVKEVRKYGTQARIVLAASFASVLVEPTGTLPFFVHSWGGTGTGKTVAAMLAASVWGNPQKGKYMRTFKSTDVGIEVSASFVNSMPLVLNELQVVKERKDFDNLIYMLCEGIGKTRGAKFGGLQTLLTWQNCIITNGEMPITNCASGGGAVNRVIEIDCKDTMFFQDAPHVADIIKKNFGFAGKQFVETLQQDDNLQYAVDKQKEIYSKILETDTTEKQAMAASVLFAADYLIEKWLFQDGITLKQSDLQQYLLTKKDVSQHERALEFIFDFVAINPTRFIMPYDRDPPGELWGRIDDEHIYFIQTKFDKVLIDEGFNPTAFRNWLKQGGHTVCEPKRTVKNARIGGLPCRCVILVKDKCFTLENSAV